MTGVSKKILNLTNHKLTPELVSEGVVDIPDDKKERLSELLSFSGIPTHEELRVRASEIAAIADYVNYVIHDSNLDSVLIDVPHYFAVLVCEALRDVYLYPVFPYVDPNTTGGLDKGIFRV